MTTRVYLDASPVIYLVQQVAPFVDAVLAQLDTPDVVIVASELTRMECRIKPLRDGDASLLEEFERFFDGSVPEMVPLNRAVLDQAAVIRASHGFRTPEPSTSRGPSSPDAISSSRTTAASTASLVSASSPSVREPDGRSARTTVTVGVSFVRSDAPRGRLKDAAADHDRHLGVAPHRQDCRPPSSNTPATRR